MTEVDFIIVGGGTAGCVLANRLSADARNRVTVIEAGDRDTSPYIRVPAAVGRAIMHPRLAWAIPGEPDGSRVGRVETFRVGKTLGGSSSINGLFFSRGQHEDFDDWAALGNDGWAFRDVLPYFKKIETAEMGDEAWRGRSGPLRVSTLRSVHRLSPVFLQAAADCGIPLTTDYNGATQAGASLAQVTQHRGARHSASRAYLHPVRSRRNLDVLTGSRCTRLLFDGRRCIGVEFERHGTTSLVYATREVILAAGALGSPRLLLLSGVGSAAELRDLGIPIVADLPGVGRNLREHPDVTVSAHVNVDTYNIIARSPLRIAWAVLQWLVSGRGPATSPYSQAVAFFSSNPGTSRPDLEMLFAPFSTSAASNRTSPHVRPAVNVIVSLCRPNPSGRVTLHPKDPRGAPRIELNLLSDDDLPTLIAGCRMARRLLASKPFAPFYEGERLPGPHVQTDEEWTQFLRSTVYPGSHLSGTCKMGTDPDAVVSPRLNVRGVERLRVVDASIMPTLISANTAAVVFMIAERAAEWILSA